MIRKNAEKSIKNYMCRDCGTFLGGGDCKENCTVLQCINALSEQKWIPVSERLPEEDERILISVNGKRGKQVRSATYLGGNCKSFWSDTGEFWDLNKKEDEKKLIAWMPLPEPYEQEE